MEILKKFFPYSFKAKKDVAALIVNIIVYLVAELIAGAIIGLVSTILGGIAILAWALGVVGGLVGLYALIGIVLSILDYLKVIK